jgi:hypothetical protein
MNNGKSLDQLAVFNPGHDYEPYTRRNKPNIIPRIMHQVWVGGEFPPAKEQLRQLNMRRLPGFKFKLWTDKDITPENFPLSYELLRTVGELNKRSKFSKGATMADMMRHEILYREGGFYMDTSMYLFDDVLEKWLSYKAVLPSDVTFRHRWSQGMCLYGHVAGFAPVLRAISYFNTNRYNIFLRNALDIAGPDDFKQLVLGGEEYDPDYLVLRFDVFYPMAYRLPNSFETYCAIQKELLEEGEEIAFEFRERVIPANCKKYYKNSHGKEINYIGSTWQNPRW